MNDCNCSKCQLNIKPSWLVMQHLLRTDITFHRIMWAVKYNNGVIYTHELD